MVGGGGLAAPGRRGPGGPPQKRGRVGTRDTVPYTRTPSQYQGACFILPYHMYIYILYLEAVLVSLFKAPQFEPLVLSRALNTRVNLQMDVVVSGVGTPLVLFSWETSRFLALSLGFRCFFGFVFCSFLVGGCQKSNVFFATTSRVEQRNQTETRHSSGPIPQAREAGWAQELKQLGLQLLGDLFLTHSHFFFFFCFYFAVLVLKGSNLAIGHMF